MNRAGAWALLTEFTQSDSLRKHALAVEASMRAYADRYRADPETWGMAGMLHDFDYEKYPDLETGHPRIALEELRKLGYPEELIDAVAGHATYLGVPRVTPLAKTLFAVDELSGFVTACALVRPGRAIAGLEAGSVKKKLKDKGFARTVNRHDVYRGAEELGVDLDEHIGFVIAALTAVAPRIGLGGPPS